LETLADLEKPLEAMNEEPLYNIGAVTRATGIPIATLHAWERRYGFPHPSARTVGGHRLYSEKDIALLRSIRDQISQGISAHQAVAVVKNQQAEGRWEQAPAAGSQLSAPIPQAHTLFPEPLTGALLDHDLDRADRILGEMLAFHSPEELTLNTIRPVLSQLGEAWEKGRISVATEHLASNYLRHRLLMWMVTGPAPRPVAPIVLACPPGEWHEGSLLMLGVLLRRRGWPTAYLGQSVPFADLATFVEQIQPSTVILVAMQKESAIVLAGWPGWIIQIGSSPVIAYGGRAFVGQPGLQNRTPGIYLGDDLQSGVDKLEQILGALVNPPA
jgi:DNA-binding transcriptional MerR regulator